MDWLRENWFWLTVLVFFVIMHAGHGHGGHAGHQAHGGAAKDQDDDLSGDERGEHSPREVDYHDQH